MAEEVTYADIKFSKIPGEGGTGAPNSAAASTPPTHRAVLLCHNHSEPDGRKPLQLDTSDSSKYKNGLRKIFCVDPNTGKEAELCELCPEGWKKGYNGSCYFISTQYNSWNSASESCSKLGAHLAVIEDKEELEVIYSAARRGYRYWIGLSRREEGDWKWCWIDNTQLDKKVSFTPIQNQHCGYMSYGSLYPGECQTLNQWICEQEAVRV
ncbi:natural killer cells antigen CD94-like isoform X2 [Polyodon spathula]|uniref:natural killer cells antigen CD94-like isoform X2 n=1 Tax=Polyodon spathula TaxID=7913 RepID=UPI001B7E15CA|nr:natural killer cells antigen CD94-like isoform X2 [Polyodon spathula]